MNSLISAVIVVQGKLSSFAKVNMPFTIAGRHNYENFVAITPCGDGMAEIFETIFP